MVINSSTIVGLEGTNTYNGNTTIAFGTLALGPTGSISNSAAVHIYASATLDVSAIPSFFLSSSTALAAGENNTNNTLATLNGGTTVNLGAQPVNLTFTPTAFTGDITHPALVVSQGALTLNNNTFTVTNAAATPLGAGTYTVAQVTGGTINQNATPSYPVAVTGTGLAANMGAYIQVSGGNVNLVVASDVPVAGSPTYYRASGTALKISLTNLMSNASDPAQQPLQLFSVDGAVLANNTIIATTANGSTLYVDSNYDGSAYLILTAANNNSESFPYVVSNTVATLTASGTINIVVTNAVGATGSISTVGIGTGSVTTTWAGVVGDNYIVQRSTNLVSGAGWVNIWTTNTVPGVFNFTDTFPDIIPADGLTPPAQAFYRLQSN